MSSRLEIGLRKVRGLLAKLNRAPREELLRIPGLGHQKVDSILRKRGTRLLAQISGERGDSFVPTVLKYAVYYEEMMELSRPKHPRDVVSVDLGLHNSACAHLTADLRLLSWRRLSLVMPKPYSPDRCYEEVWKSLEELPEAEVYIIELASQRSMVHNSGFLDISVQLKSLEAMFYGILRTVKDVPVLTILPRMTSQYFDVSHSQRRAKKKAAVDLVTNLISTERLHTDAVHQIVVTPLGNRVNCLLELVEYFEKEDKKDDLSDSLLQAVGFMEWSQMAKELTRPS